MKNLKNNLIFISMNKSYSKIRHIQQSNLIMESRYLFEGTMTLQQILQGRQLTLFKRTDDTNSVEFSHMLENKFQKGDWYKNIYISFGVSGRKNENVQILIICENPAYIDMARKITESLNGFKDVVPIFVLDDGDETDKHSFQYEVMKTISLENLSAAFDGIKRVVEPIGSIDGNLFVNNPDWVK
jgi:hypothetical protein